MCASSMFTCFFLQVQTVKEAGSSNTYVAQKLLYFTVRNDCQELGVELQRPEAIYDRPRVQLRNAIKDQAGRNR